MSNYENKFLKIRTVTASALVALGLIAIPAIGQAQQTDAWTGAVPGTNIYLNTNDMLNSIRSMLNNNDIDGAVKSAQRYVDEMEREKRSGKTTEYRYDAYNALCISLTAQKNYKEAMEACNTAIGDSPARWFAYNSRGSLNFRSGNFANAVSDYRMALERAPKSGEMSMVIEHNIELAQSQN